MTACFVSSMGRSGGHQRKSKLRPRCTRTDLPRKQLGAVIFRSWSVLPELSVNSVEGERQQ